MKDLIRLSMYSTLLVTLCISLRYPAGTTVRHIHPPATSDSAFLRLINQRLREPSPVKTNLPSPGSVRILRTLVLNDTAAVIGTYPLRHAARGCSGTIRMTAFRSGPRWDTGGFEANKTCLSMRLPLEFGWSRSVWGERTLLVLSGRALPSVASVRLIHRLGSSTKVPLHNGAFIIFGSHTGIRLVQI